MDFTTNCMGFPLSTPIIAGSPGVTGSVKRVKALVDAGTIVGSYGWGGKTVETVAGMIPNLKVDVSTLFYAKGFQRRMILNLWIGWPVTLRKSTKKTILDNGPKTR